MGRGGPRGSAVGAAFGPRRDQDPYRVRRRRQSEARPAAAAPLAPWHEPRYARGVDTGEGSGALEASNDDAPRPGQDEGTGVPFGTLRPSERVALILCAFAAMCVLLLPGELAGAGICAALAIGLTVWHRIRNKRERAAAPQEMPPP